MNHQASHELFHRAQALMPGGVNSPVRAFKSVGGEPFFARRAEGAKALKLLLLWRPDEDPEGRIALATDFVERCRRSGMISIIFCCTGSAVDGVMYCCQNIVPPISSGVM